MSNPPLIIAHRGASHDAPENTLTAFQIAMDAGADGIEFDVQLASDGVPVVIHDPDLLRTARRPERVSDLTSVDLANIDVGSWFQDEDSTGNARDFSSERVQTLDAVLDAFTSYDGLIYIELKSESAAHPHFASIVSSIIRNSPLLPRIVVKSFKLSLLADMKCEMPNVTTAALFTPGMLQILRKKKYLIDLAREFRADQISLHRSLATKKLVARASRAGLPVTVWTVDSPKWIERCRERGIHALITNVPGRMIEDRDSA